MQPEHQNTELWLQYGAQPGDTAAELLRKQQMLNIIKQAIHLYIDRASHQQDVDVITANQPGRCAACDSSQNQQNAHVQQQHQSSTFPPAQQHQQEQYSQQQNQEPKQSTATSPLGPDAADQWHRQHQQHDQLRLEPKQHSNTIHPRSRAELTKATTAGARDKDTRDLTDAAKQPKSLLQQQQQQQLLPWKATNSKQQPAAHQRQLQPEQSGLQQQQQRSKHRPQQYGGRRRMLPQVASKLAQQQQVAKTPQQRPLQLQEQQSDILQCQQQLWLHPAHTFTDAQSQAAGLGSFRAGTAPPTAASNRPCSTLQHLFSPRTATHSPLAAGYEQQRRCDDRAQRHGHQPQQEQNRQQQQQHLHRTVHMDVSKPNSFSPQQQQHHHHHQHITDESKQKADQQGTLLLSTPLRSLEQQQQQVLQTSADWMTGAAAAAAAATATAVVAATPSACQMVPGTPCSEGPGPPEAAAAAATATAAHSADDAGMFGSELYLLGSVVAESPAVPESAAEELGATAAAAAAAARCEVSVVQQLFQTEAAAADTPFDAGSKQQQQQQQLPVMVEQDDKDTQQQLLDSQQQDVHQQQGSPRISPAIVSDWPSSSFQLHQHQQRVVSIDVTLPVVALLTGQQQCLVIMQQDSVRSKFELLCLNLQQQQQQEGSVNVQLGCLAQLDAAAAANPSPASIAAGMQMLPWPAHRHSTSSSSSVEYPGAAGSDLFLAAVCTLRIHSAGNSPQNAANSSPTAAVTPVTAAAGLIAAENQGDSGVAVATASTGRSKASLRSLTHSSGKKKALLGHRAAARTAATAAAASPEPTEQHGVNIYCLRAACPQTQPQPQQQQQQQQQESSVAVVQGLRTAAAVTCLAVCGRSGLLAAAGAAGFACVWKLLPHLSSSSSSTAVQQQPQQQRGLLTPCIDESSNVVLPAAAYRGISFPDFSDLCLMLQPGSSSSSSSGDGRVLLVGCCVQGSVAVWDVSQQQQIIAVHSPDINIHSLFPLLPRLPHKVMSRDVDVRQEQQQSDVVLLLLALMATREDGTTAAVTPPAVTGGGRRPQLLSKQQQQQLELRPLLLQQPGSLIPGSALLAGVQQQLRQRQQPSASGVLAAACDGVCVAAAVAGVVGVWDIISGQQLMQATAADSGDDVLSVGVMLFEGDQQQQQQQQRCRTDGQINSKLGQGVVLMGSAQGRLTLALL